MTYPNVYHEADIRDLLAVSPKQLDETLAYSNFPRPIAFGADRKRRLWSRAEVNVYLRLPVAFYPTEEWEKRLSDCDVGIDELISLVNAALPSALPSAPGGSHE